MTVLTMLTTILVALITAVFGPVAVEWAKNKFTPKSQSKSLVGEAIEMNKLVDDQLEVIMDELKCDRIWVAQFHNGGHFYPTGKSIQKFSFFYEKISPNTHSIQHTFQNIPVSLFPKSLSKLYKDGELAIPSYSNANKDNVDVYDLEVFHNEYNTKSFYAIAISDLNDHFIGVMGIAYVNKEHKLTKDEWIFTRQKIGVVGTLLTEYLNIKK
jgi:hypothetical protein